MVDIGVLNRIHQYMIKNQLRTESEAVREVFKSYDRLYSVVKKLEEKAHEGELWKERAESHLKTSTLQDTTSEPVKIKKH